MSTKVIGCFFFVYGLPCFSLKINLILFTAFSQLSSQSKHNYRTDFDIIYLSKLFCCDNWNILLKVIIDLLETFAHPDGYF